jgi:hypothetical protein
MQEMNNQEGLDYIRGYFGELFGKRNINALDNYLDQAFFDDDIGDPSVDHVQKSKEYIKDLFKREPTIGVDVIDAITYDNVITAYLVWYRMAANEKQIIRKGVGIFVMNDRRINRHHTYIYESR